MRSDRAGPLGGLLLGAWIGLVAGFLDSIARRGWTGFSGQVPSLGLHLWWMPAVGLGLFLALSGLVLGGIGHRWPRLMAPAVILALLGFGGFLDVLLVFSPRLARWAAVVLALGLAVQLGRWSVERMGVVDRWRRRSLPLLAALAVLIPAGIIGREHWLERQALAALPPVSGRPPNVLLLVLDTVRAFNLSTYGYLRPTSPTLTRLAARGARFDQAISTAPWTLPSHAGIFTGRWHHELSTNWETGLDRRYPTVAEALSAAGYASAGFIANTIYCGRDFGLDRGFSHYEDLPLTPAQIFRASKLGMQLADHTPLGRLVGPGQWQFGRKTATGLVDDVLAWQQREGERPFFVFVNFFDAHEHYYAPGSYDSLFIDPDPRGNVSSRRPIADYDRAIRYIDTEIGRLLDSLEARGVLEHTLVIVTADHGEEFDEHGILDHGNSLYAAALRVPLVLALPGTTPAVVLPQTVSLRDLPRTLLDLTGAGDPTPFPGQSLARFWRTPGLPGDSVLAEVRHARNQPEGYPISHGDMRSALADSGHLIVRGDGRPELYDFQRDSFELRDRVSDPAAAVTLDNLSDFLSRQPAGPFQTPAPGLAPPSVPEPR